MIITAKYSSVCPVCKAAITAGLKVEWTSGSKARHPLCATNQSATPTTALHPTSALPVVTSSRRTGHGTGKCAKCGARCQRKYALCFSCSSGSSLDAEDMGIYR